MKSDVAPLDLIGKERRGKTQDKDVAKAEKNDSRGDPACQAED